MTWEEFRARVRRLGVAVPEGEPVPELLYGLAPELGVRVPDVFVLAGLGVPEELNPLDAEARSSVAYVVWRFRLLPAAQRTEFLQHVRSLPQEPRTALWSPLREFGGYPPGPGALLLRLLANRNLHWSSGAQAVAGMAGPYLSPATIGGVGRGVVALSPELFIAFARVLGIPPDRLAVLVDADPPAEEPSHHPDMADAAELLWELRRLSREQVRQARERLPESA
ncbi:hypothetical protein DF268_30525 [Streptomyces sp. V2]|uniref:Uncharacterized protein n=1 Tax=Streptomyces niveiscabiei TaxID=164115 RepID=A0ABW9HQC6_9ACTN|nr:hypothetical protein [Streptomyces sp. V2]PWG09765.1 hypothetical protein DF268_30525 [Streptomyces sp. V2]